MNRTIPDIVCRLPWARLVPSYQGNRLLTCYVALVGGGGLALLVLQGGAGSLASWAFLLWFGFSVAAEFLWLETPTGEATDSMASTFNVAVLYLFGNTLSLWIVGLSVLLATRYIQRRDWPKSLFGFGQMVVTAFVAGTVFRGLAGGPATIEHFSSILGLAGLLCCCIAYFVVNTALVAGAVSLEKGLSIWKVLRENYLYRNSITSSGTLFALSPILLLSYLSIGYPGVILFFLPLVIVKNQNRAHIALQKATENMIVRERMAAKGEMAAAIAHEMNNFLAVLSGRTELLRRKIEKRGLTDFVRDGEILWTQIERLARLAKGLLQFTPGQLKVDRFDLNALCQETIEFLAPQNLFDNVRLELELEPGLGEIDADQAQVQQILLNLCRNAAQAMRDVETPDREIRVRTCFDEEGYARFEVEDNGPGIPEGKRARVFEPGFTTKKDGHGFGLATCFTIMENHKGRIWIEERPGGGTRFLAALPHKKACERQTKAA